MDFLLISVNWTFSASCYGWGATSDYWLKIGDFAPTRAPTNHSSSQKTRLNELSYGILILTDLSTVLSQCTRVTDRRTDRQAEFSSLDRVCIPCSAVKNENEIAELKYHRWALTCHECCRLKQASPTDNFQSRIVASTRHVGKCKGAYQRWLQNILNIR